jgi:type II secretory pathway pseudopilin PulG
MFSLFSHSFTNNQSRHLPQSRGFGLIELMVSISIMMLVSAVIMARQSAFNGAVLLRGEMYSVAMAVREVQLSAVSAESNGSGSFRAVEGVFFNTANTNVYNIFRDANHNFLYDTGEQYGKQGIIDNRFQLNDILIYPAPSGNETSISAISVVFERPNFDARFFNSNGVEINTPKIVIQIAKEGVAPTPEVEKRLEITRTGQITVQ